jgi:hypothetical protein
VNEKLLVLSFFFRKTIPKKDPQLFCALFSKIPTSTGQELKNSTLGIVS